MAKPQVGEIWARIGGKERVRVDRIWEICACDALVMHGYDPEHGAGSVDAIRVQPRHGGKWWWTVMPAFLERFKREEESPVERRKPRRSEAPCRAR